MNKRKSIERIVSFVCFFQRYYFAFIFSEAINNAGGLGFNGFDEKGQPRWNLLTNIKPFELERATSLKVTLDVWNIRKTIEEIERKIQFDYFSFRNGTLASTYLLQSFEKRPNIGRFCSLSTLGKSFNSFSSSVSVGLDR